MSYLGKTRQAHVFYARVAQESNLGATKMPASVSPEVEKDFNELREALKDRQQGQYLLYNIDNGSSDVGKDYLEAHDKYDARFGTVPKGSGVNFSVSLSEFEEVLW